MSRTPRATRAISVLMPTYNRAHLIGPSVESILRQTHEVFELVVYDDGSTDDTESVVRSFGDDRLRYVKSAENRGVAAARNELLHLARHEVACWQDSDDISNVHRLAIQLPYLERHKIVLSTSVWLSKCPPGAWRRPPGSNTGEPAHASAMFRVDVDILCDLRFSISGEDVAWLGRMQKAHGPYLLLNRQLYYIRNHPDRIGMWKRDPRRNAEWYRRMSSISEGACPE